MLPDPFEFRGIREYQGFDTMRSINWLATAKTGDLKVNVHEFTASREVYLLLNIEPDGAFYEEDLIEEGIRIAASLCTYLVQDGVSCGLISNARDVITGETIDMAAGQSIQHVQQVQEQLGRLDPVEKTRHFLRPDRVSQLWRQPRSGSPDDFTELQRGCLPGVVNLPGARP